jgi:hypothetical protein
VGKTAERVLLFLLMLRRSLIASDLLLIHLVEHRARDVFTESEFLTDVDVSSASNRGCVTNSDTSHQ